MTLREALISMGYTEKKPGVWMKPIGFQLFVVHEANLTWVNWFKSMPGDIAMWEKKILQTDQDHYGSYLHQLKMLECFTRTDVYVEGKSQFELGGIDFG